MVRSVSDFRKEEIVNATIRSLEKHGLPPISYDLIAEQANTSRQLIRHYYPDAEEILVDILDSISESYRSTVFESILDLNLTERLSILMDFFLGPLGREKGPPSSLFDAMFALSTRSAKVKKTMNAVHQRLADTFSTEIGLSIPELHYSAADEIGYQFACLVTGHWRMVSSIGLSDEYIPVARLAMDRIIQSYIKDAEAEASSTKGKKNG